MGWWFGRKSAPADMRPFVPAWLTTAEAEEGFARSVDAPLGEPSEQYAVNVQGPSGTIERTVQAPAISLGPSDLVAAGSGAAMLSVRQIGGCAASRPSQISLTLP